MIIGRLSDSERIEKLNPRFKQIFDYIKTHNLLHAPVGKIDIDGENAWISVDEPEMREKSEASIEIHRQYTDIQVPLQGKETFGWQSVGNLKSEKSAYSPENDIAFYNDPVELYFTLSPGEFVIFFPEDGHAPCIGEGKTKKLVAKIKIPVEF